MKKEEDVRYYLYHIHRKGNDKLTEGYIGISNSPEARFRSHKSEARKGNNYHLYKAIRKYEDIKYTILCVGSREYITDLENRLRPKPHIGWNTAVGGDKPKLGLTPPEEQVVKQAEKLIQVSRLDVLNIWYEYYEKGVSSNIISEKYPIDSRRVRFIIEGKSRAYPDLEEVRQVFIENRKFSSNQRRSLSEKQYDLLLKEREAGRNYKYIADKYQMKSGTVKDICLGKYKYLRKFSCHRIVDIPTCSAPAYHGKTQTIKEWSEELGIKFNTLRSRLGKGWSVQKAFETPVRGGNK